MAIEHSILVCLITFLQRAHNQQLSYRSTPEALLQPPRRLLRPARLSILFYRARFVHSIHTSRRVPRTRSPTAPRSVPIDA